MPKISVDQTDFEYTHVPTAKTNILLIQAAHGFLACGYFDVAVATKVGDAAAIVTGVRTPEQMLTAQVVRLSDKALEAGVKEGMTGKEALLLLNQKRA